MRNVICQANPASDGCQLRCRSFQGSDSKIVWTIWRQFKVSSGNEMSNRLNNQGLFLPHQIKKKSEFLDLFVFFLKKLQLYIHHDFIQLIPIRLFWRIQCCMVSRIAKKCSKEYPPWHAPKCHCKVKEKKKKKPSQKVLLLLIPKLYNPNK